MKEAIRRYIPRFVFDKLKEVEIKYEVNKWEKAGKPIPPVHSVKRLVIRAYQKKSGYKILIETGTYKGDMIYAQLKFFDKIYSIELSDYYYNEAVKRFKKFTKIELLHGDSSKRLGEIVNKLNEPAIFWLDGHYSGGLTGKGEKESPIWGELNAIVPTKLPHILLIDDARCFTGENDYPSIAALNEFFTNTGLKYNFEVKNDVIRIELMGC